jgi:hypothetical protein
LLKLAKAQSNQLDLPEDYIFYQWRKLMGVSYNEMLETPIEVVMRDLSFRDVEVRVENHLSKPKN